MSIDPVFIIALAYVAVEVWSHVAFGKQETPDYPILPDGQDWKPKPEGTSVNLKNYDSNSSQHR